jgi:hypothetical protein
MFKFFRKKPKTLLDQFIVTVFGDNPPAPRRANLELAIDLSHSALLMGTVDKIEVKTIASGLFDGEIPYSTHDLAAATALHFFRQPELKNDLEHAQLMARMTVFDWFKENKVNALMIKVFEDSLYRQYS